MVEPLEPLGRNEKEFDVAVRELLAARAADLVALGTPEGAEGRAETLGRSLARLKEAGNVLVCATLELANEERCRELVKDAGRDLVRAPRGGTKR